MYSWLAHQSLSEVISFSSCEGDRRTRRRATAFLGGREGGMLDIVHLLPSILFLSHRNRWKPTVTAALGNFHIFSPDTKQVILFTKIEVGKKNGVSFVEMRWGISKWMRQWPFACYLHCDDWLSLAEQLCVAPNTERPHTAS